MKTTYKKSAKDKKMETRNHIFMKYDTNEDSKGKGAYNLLEYLKGWANEGK